MRPFTACESPSPAAPPASASRSSRAARRGRPRRLRRPHARARRAVAARPPGNARHRRRRRRGRTTSTPSPCRSSPRSAGSTCSSTTPRASGRRRSRCSPTPTARTSTRALGHEPARPVPPDQGAARRAGRLGPRRPRRVVLNVSSDAAINAYPGWGAYGASKAALRHMSAHLGRGACGRRRALPVARPGRHGHAAARARRARRRPGDAQAAGGRRARARRRHREAALAVAGARMIAAATRAAACADARCSSSMRTARSAHAARAEPRRVSASPAIWSSPTTPPPCPPACTACMCRAGRRSRCGLPAARSLARDDVREFTAVVFGAGDYRTRTEDRPPPPPLAPGDRLALGPLRRDGRAACSATRGSSRCASTARPTRSGPASRGTAGRSSTPTSPSRSRCGTCGRRVAALPVAFEPPSAGFALDWRMLGSAAQPRRRLRHPHARGRHLVHRRSRARCAAAVRRALPHSREATAARDRRARASGGRIVAVGTTVVRALEHAARCAAAARRRRLATQRIGRGTALRVVDAILSGTHEPGDSHFELLRAFTGRRDAGADDRSARARATARTSSAIRSWSSAIAPEPCPPPAPRSARSLKRAVPRRRVRPHGRPGTPPWWGWTGCRSDRPARGPRRC